MATNHDGDDENLINVIDDQNDDVKPLIIGQSCGEQTSTSNPTNNTILVPSTSRYRLTNVLRGIAFFDFITILSLWLAGNC